MLEDVIRVCHKDSDSTSVRDIRRAEEVDRPRREWLIRLVVKRTFALRVGSVLAAIVKPIRLNYRLLLKPSVDGIFVSQLVNHYFLPKILLMNERRACRRLVRLLAASEICCSIHAFDPPDSSTFVRSL